MALVFLGLGSNLNNPLEQILRAQDRIFGDACVTPYAHSSLYASQPLDGKSQANYVNSVIGIYTQLSALDLLDWLQQIENQQGRVRTEHWGSRTLDIDILLYDDQRISEPRLKVPHYDIGRREFVLVPLFEICPDLIFPDGRTLLAQLIQLQSQLSVPWNGLYRLLEKEQVTARINRMKEV